MIPEAAKRFVEQIGFEEKSKSLLSGCFVHRCHVIHLLRREVHPLLSNVRMVRPARTDSICFFEENDARKRKRGKEPQLFRQL